MVGCWGWVATPTASPSPTTWSSGWPSPTAITRCLLAGCACVDGGVREWQADYYVRDLSLASEIDLSRLVALLQERGAWRQTLCQRVPVWAVSCRDFILAASELLATAPYALIRAGGESHAV